MQILKKLISVFNDVVASDMSKRDSFSFLAILQILQNTEVYSLIEEELEDNDNSLDVSDLLDILENKLFCCRNELEFTVQEFCISKRRVKVSHTVVNAIAVLKATNQTICPTLVIASKQSIHELDKK